MFSSSWWIKCKRFRKQAEVYGFHCKLNDSCLMLVLFLFLVGDKTWGMCHREWKIAATFKTFFYIYMYFFFFCPCNDSFPRVIAMLVLISKRETMLRSMFGGPNSAWERMIVPPNILIWIESGQCQLTEHWLLLEFRFPWFQAQKKSTKKREKGLKVLPVLYRRPTIQPPSSRFSSLRRWLCFATITILCLWMTWQWNTTKLW